MINKQRQHQQPQIETKHTSIQAYLRLNKDWQNGVEPLKSAQPYLLAVRVQKGAGGQNGTGRPT